MYIKGNAFKIQTLSHCNLIRSSVTFPPPILSPSSNLPPPVSRCSIFLEMKNPARLSEMFFDFFFSFLNCTSEIGNCLSWGAYLIENTVCFH